MMLDNQVFLFWKVKSKLQFNYSVSSNSCAPLGGCRGGAVDLVISVLHIYIDKASTYRLRPCLSQFDKWSLIYAME